MSTLKEIRQQNFCGNSCRGCESLTYCSDCEEKICSMYDHTYRNIDETGETFCECCLDLKKQFASFPKTTEVKSETENND